MEVGKSYEAAGINSRARNAALDIVRAAETSEDLLVATTQHFNENVLSLTADQILAQLPDETLDPKLQDTVGFDPVLYRAVVLFELSHLSDDESVIPKRMESVVDFWQTAWKKSAEELDRMLTAETRRTYYQPFGVISQHVKLGFIIESLDEQREQRANDEPVPESDPLQKEIDGTRYKIFFGNEELKLDSPESYSDLTDQLVHDLHKLYPRAVVRELEYMFPDGGTFQEIYPRIEAIMQDRADGVVPPIQELIDAYVRSDRKILKWFRSYEAPVLPPEELAEKALEQFMDDYRSLKSRTVTRDVYVQPEGKWYTVDSIASDTEVNVYYRRVYYGDRFSPERIEVPVEQRAAVIAEEERNRREIHHDTPESERPAPKVIHDVFGPII